MRREAVVERSSRHSYYVLGVESFDGSGEPVSSRSSWLEVPTTSTSWQISLGLGAGDGRRNCRLDCHEREIGSASRTNNSMTEEKDKEEDEDEDEKSMGHTNHQAVQLDCVSVFMSSRCRSRWKVKAEVSLFVRWGSGQAWSGIYTDSKPGQIEPAAGFGGEATPSREKGGGGRRHGDRQPIPAHHRPERSIQRSTGGGGQSNIGNERVGKRGYSFT